MITAEPPVVAAPPPSGEPGRLGRVLDGAVFLAPALVMLGVWMVYPAIYTIIRSFFGQTGFLGTWVGIDNYRHLFSTSTLTTAIKNNAIWVAVVPALVTAIGLDLCRAHRARPLGVAFKTVGVPADGDLGVRNRRDLADHVPAGSGPRRDQRARQDDLRSRQPGRRSSALHLRYLRCSRPRAAHSSSRRRCTPARFALLR